MKRIAPLILLAALVFTGCQTTSGVRQIPNLTPAQVQQLSAAGNSAIDVLQGAGLFKTQADADKARAQIASAAAVAEISSQLVDIVNQLLKQQAAVAQTQTPPPATGTVTRVAP